MNTIQKDICTLVSHLMSQDICTLVYRDRDGVTSIRYIRVLGIEKASNGHHFVRAYDTQRDAPRSFRIASIEAVFSGAGTLAIQPREAEAQPEVYEPAIGDTIRFHYTAWPYSLADRKTPEHSNPFTYESNTDSIADGMRRSGWEFTIEKVD